MKIDSFRPIETKQPSARAVNFVQRRYGEKKTLSDGDEERGAQPWRRTRSVSVG